LSTCFLIYWQFGYFQHIFSPQQWSCLGPKVKKNWKEKANVYASYFFFYFFVAFYFAAIAKSFADYYSPTLFPLKVMNPVIYESFGWIAGPFAILIGSHANFMRFYVMFFYMIVLGLICDKLEQFVGDLKEVGFDFVGLFGKVFGQVIFGVFKEIC
jgi:hypothetical protein